MKCRNRMNLRENRQTIITTQTGKANEILKGFGVQIPKENNDVRRDLRTRPSHCLLLASFSLFLIYKGVKKSPSICQSDLVLPHSQKTKSITSSSSHCYSSLALWAIGSSDDVYCIKTAKRAILRRQSRGRTTETVLIMLTVRQTPRLL